MAYLDLSTIKYSTYYGRDVSGTTWTTETQSSSVAAGKNTVYLGKNTVVSGATSSYPYYVILELEIKFPVATTNPKLQLSRCYITQQTSNQLQASTKMTYKGLLSTSKLSTSSAMYASVKNGSYTFTHGVGAGTFYLTNITYFESSGYQYYYSYPCDLITLNGTFNANQSYYFYIVPSSESSTYQNSRLWMSYNSSDNKTELTSQDGTVAFQVEYTQGVQYTITYTAPPTTAFSAPAQALTYSFKDFLNNTHTYTQTINSQNRITSASGTSQTQTISDSGNWTTKGALFTTGQGTQVGWTRYANGQYIVKMYGPNSSISNPQYGLNATTNYHGNASFYPVFAPKLPTITAINGSPDLIDVVGVYNYSTNSLVTSTSSVAVVVPTLNYRYHGARLKDIYGVNSVSWQNFTGTTTATTTPYITDVQACNGMNASTTGTYKVNSITYNSYRVIYGKNSPSPAQSNVNPVSGTESNYSSYTSYTYNNTIKTIAAPTHNTVTFTSTQDITANINIDQNGGTRGDATITSSGTAYIATPRKYTFAGWQDRDSDTVAIVSANTNYTLNATNFPSIKKLTNNGVICLNAVWETQDLTSTVTYSFNSITLPDVDDLHHSTGALMGFSTSPTAIDPDYLPGSTYTPTSTDTTLYAVWGCTFYKRSPKVGSSTSIAGAPAVKKIYTFNDLNDNSVSYTAYPFPSEESEHGYELLNASTTSICTTTKTIYLEGNPNNYLGIYHYNDTVNTGENTNEYKLIGFTQTGWTKANASKYIFEIDGIDDGYSNTSQYDYNQTITLTDNLTLYPQFEANIYNYTVSNSSTDAIDQVAIYNYKNNTLSTSSTTATASAPFMGMIYLEAKLKNNDGYNYTFNKWEYSEDNGQTYKTLTTSPVYATPYNSYSSNVKFRASAIKERNVSGVRIYSTTTQTWHLYEPYIYTGTKWQAADAYVYENDWKPMD